MTGLGDAEPTREDPWRAYVRPWIQLAERQLWRIDGPANLREYPRGPCVGWAPDDATVAVSRAWNDWVKVGVIKPRYGPPEAAPELIEGWPQTRNLRLANPSPGRSYDEAILGPQLLPAPELPCPRHFPYGYRFAAINDAHQHRALQRFVWKGRRGLEQPAAISSDDPAAEVARCIAIGPQRDRNRVKWCCR